MKFMMNFELDMPRDKVIELFDNPDNLTKWQPELVNFTHESGESGRPGAKSCLHYHMGRQEFDLVETVTKRELSDEFSGTYEAPGGRNHTVNRFSELGPDKTKWTVYVEFEGTSLMMKLMMFFRPGAF